MKLLCLEILKNGQKVALAGVKESGVLSVIVDWVGKGTGAAAKAAAETGPVPNLGYSIGGIDSSDPAGDRFVDWNEKGALRIGDELLVRVIAAEVADKPLHSKLTQPLSQTKDMLNHKQCSFCGQMRDTKKQGGLAGVSNYICERCLIFAERLLDDNIEKIFHLSMAKGKQCSFCLTSRSKDSASTGDSRICRGCVDTVMK